MKKRFLALLLVGAIGASMLSGCGKADDAKQTTVKKTETDKKEEIEFWYHDGNPISNPIFEELIKRFEEKYPQYTVKYVGLPVDSYLQKMNTAIATNTVPDVVSIRDMDLSTFVNQEAVMPLDEIFASHEEKESFSVNAVNAVRSCASDGILYCIPQYITTNISWCNTKMLEEKGIEIPKTIDEFLSDCEAYADPESGTYFYSLRGGAGSLDNLFDFLFTCANQDNLFDEEGNCVLDQDIFAEALDQYAGIYWNNWVSKDSITNGFKEMVAEFGSGTSMYMGHNSSSLAEHKKNLGEGNFINMLSPANSEGITVTKDLSFVGYGMFKQENVSQGAIEFLKYITSSEASSYLCEQEGRIPVNEQIYSHEWYASNPYNQIYKEITTSETVKFITHPIWLPQWNEFKTKYQEPDLQAVLLKEKTSKEVLASWADYLTKAQKEYLQSK